MLLAARAFVVWLLLITAEVVHGIVRTLVLAPVVGDFRARQLGVFTGSLLILLITALTIRWIRASRPRTLLMIGSAWVVLTMAFEIGLGRMIGLLLGTPRLRLQHARGRPAANRLRDHGDLAVYRRTSEGHVGITGDTT